MKRFYTYVIFTIIFGSWLNLAPAQNVVFPDANLANKVREALNLPAGAVIREAQLATLTGLDAGATEDTALEAKIRDLTGLEHATQLEWLYLDSNEISDITPLAGLTQLMELFLDANEIVDLNPLTGLTELQVLSLGWWKTGGNQISDITPLATLTNLTELSLWGNQISDITPLTSLTALTILDLGSNLIDDISPLAELTQLTHLYLDTNEISDVVPLTGLLNLEVLFIKGNPITDTALLHAFLDQNLLETDIFENNGEVPLTPDSASVTSNATVSLSPATAQSPAIGEQLTFSLKIADAENVAGYQATVSYDTTALRYVESANGDYLPSGAFFIPPIAEGDTVTLAASSIAGESDGDGTLATLTFEILAVKASTVRLTDVLLTDSSGGSSVPQIENAEITEPPQFSEDVNQDGVVNIIDLTLVASNFGKTGQNAADVNGDGVVNIIDLTLVAAAFGNTASAPEIWSFHLESMPARSDVEAWLREARQTSLSDPAFQRGILVLEQLLAALTPKETVLLPNYPNPFNPETWIPYQLAAPADVSISIYAADGKLIRTLNLGHQPVGLYESRSHAAHWDGRNAFGEPVASGIYFYTLSTESTRDSVTAGDFTATRKMLIRK